MKTIEAPAKTGLDTHPALEILRRELEEIEDNVVNNYTLADAIREGSRHTDQAYSWRNGDKVCALTAAALAVKARRG